MNVSDHGEIDLLRGPYQTLVRLYGGRDDIIAEQQKDGFYLDAMSEGLTFERFVEHVQLKKTYAIYNMDDSKRVKFGLFDLDVVDRNQGWGAIRPGIEEKRKESFRILDALLETGLKRKNILLEFPTVGFHIVIFFKEPVPAKGLKSWMGRLLDAIGLRPIPFYPRKTEDSVYGDRIQLPFQKFRF